MRNLRGQSGLTDWGPLSNQEPLLALPLQRGGAARVGGWEVGSGGEWKVGAPPCLWGPM